ncbi:MAG: ABC transporter substrate-binding protein [Nitrospinales bacterium]
MKLGKSSHPSPLIYILLVALFLEASTIWAGPQFGESEKRGKEIYTKGKGTQPISVYLSGPGLETPATGFPCIQCHKEDGLGGREGGVLAPKIAYPYLLRDNREDPANGRLRPPYDEESLAIAIQTGIDPGGNSLHPAMPRYIIQKEDLRDLLAYLKVLGNEPVPGITDEAIQIGMMFPNRGPLNAAGREVQSLLNAYFEKLNSLGGVFGLRLELKSLEFDPSNPPSTLEQTRDFLSKEPVLCFVANLGLSHDHPATQYLISEEIPVFIPLAITPKLSRTSSSEPFYLYASLFDQGRTLVDYFNERLNGSKIKIGLLYSDDPLGKDGASGVKKRMSRYSLKLAADQVYRRGEFDPVKTIRSLKQAGLNGLYFFGSGKDATSFLVEAARQNWSPLLLGSADLVGTALFSLPEDRVKKVYLTSPSFHPMPSSDTANDFFRLLRESCNPSSHLVLKRMAFAGAFLLVEGLKQVGRNITRAKLTEKVGNLWKFNTGLTPPLTYNANRHAGTLGSSIIGMDSKNKRFVLLKPWRALQ